jgi:methyl-accepting chemotaxis protein
LPAADERRTVTGDDGGKSRGITCRNRPHGRLDRGLSRRTPRTAAAAYLVARLAGELRDLDAITVRARDRLAIEASALDATTAGIRRQVTAVEKAREAADVLGTAAADVARHASALSSIYKRLPAVTASSLETLQALDKRARAVSDAFGLEANALANLDGDWKTIAGEVDGIASSGRRSGILAVNAAIEAAYVDGSGFGIVTERMRALSSATLAAASDVGAIVRRTTGSMRTATANVAQARDAMESLLHELQRARASFETASAHVTGFGDGAAQIASISEEQAATLAQLASSLVRLVELARTIDAAAAGGSHAALASSLDDATRTLASHQGYDAVTPLDRPDTGGDVLAAWLCDVADGSGAPPPALGPDDVELANAAAALVARTLDAQRVIVRGLCDAAEATAGTGVLWRAIVKDVRAFDAQVLQLGVALTESVESSASLADASRAIAEELAALDQLCSTALTAFDRALDAADAGHALGAEVSSSVGAMERATTEAEALLVQIGEVSEDAGLLAINAAIESARAGERGLAFTVIADEIGRLAKTARTATDGVVDTILSLRARSGELHAGSARQDAEMREVHDLAGPARAVVDEARTAIAASVARGVTVGETSARVAASLAAVAREISAVRDIAAATAQPEVAAARIALARLGDEALHVTERRRLGLPEERLREATCALACEVEAALETLVGAGRVGVDAMTATDYRELRGELVERLSPFFDVADAPRDGFTPPKYCTSWDHLVDGALVSILNATMASHRGVILASVFDLNGFAIAFPTQMDGIRRPDGRVDWTRWVGKGIYTDNQTLHGARVGLGPDVDQLPERMAYAGFVAHGYDMSRRTPRPWGLRTTILRGTRDVSRGASAPVYVTGKRIATVVLMERVEH